MAQQEAAKLRRLDRAEIRSPTEPHDVLMQVHQRQLRNDDEDCEKRRQDREGKALERRRPSEPRPEEVCIE